MMGTRGDNVKMAKYKAKHYKRLREGIDSRERHSTIAF
jgi:hypothetical protein